MKKFLVLCICMLMTCSLAVNAQQKGEAYFGGNLTFGVTSVGVSGWGSETTATFGIAPEFGYFVADKFKIGLGISYDYADESHMMTFMPNLAYYVPLAKNLYYVPEFSIGGGFVAGGGDSVGMFALSLKLAALEYRATQKFALGVSLVNLDYLRFSEINTFNFGILTSPTVSLKYFF